jgi:hypothetical protein
VVLSPFACTLSRPDYDKVRCDQPGAERDEEQGEWAEPGQPGKNLAGDRAADNQDYQVLQHESEAHEPIISRG